MWQCEINISPSFSLSNYGRGLAGLSTFALFELMERCGVGLGRTTDCKLCPYVLEFDAVDRDQSSVNSQFHVYLFL